MAEISPIEKTIDAARPRLGWVLHAEGDPSQRGQRQTGYRVLVASSRQLLDQDRADLWDSGKVDSGATIGVEYAGKPLASRTRCHWKVRVWDGEGAPSAWSRPAAWSMALLDTSDWQAQWIAAPQPAEQADPPAPVPMFRKEFDVPGPIRRATAYITALGCYEIWINGRRVGEEMLAPQWTDYNKRVLYQTVDVTDLVQEGPNAIGAIVAGGWYRMRGMYQPMTVSRRYYGDGIKRLLAQVEVERADGSLQTLVTDGTWRCTLDGPWQKADIYDGVTYDAPRKPKTGIARVFRTPRGSLLRPDRPHGRCRFPHSPTSRSACSNAWSRSVSASPSQGSMCLTSGGTSPASAECGLTVRPARRSGCATRR